MTFSDQTFDGASWLLTLSDESYPKHIRAIPKKIHPETDDEVAQIFYESQALEGPRSALSCCRIYAEFRESGLAVARSFEAAVEKIAAAIYQNS